MRDMLSPSLSRRRFLSIAAVASAALMPGAAGSRANRFEWRGGALGAQAAIVLYHHDQAEAEAAIAASLAEIRRLEGEFSLYQAGSALLRLNAAGRISWPSHDMRRLLQLSKSYSDLSEGAFDPTIQPLWQLYAEHFSTHASAPSPEAIKAALQLVDYRRISIKASEIRLQPGMSLTLNGIAQGYITDRVAALLRARGWDDVLLNLGEIRALPGRSWSIGLPGSHNRLELNNAAIATSSGPSSPFGAAGEVHHLLHPATGRSGGRYNTVSVLAGTAVAADALSTALFLAPPEQAMDLLRQGGGQQAWLRPFGRKTLHLTAVN
ncbi:MAG: FAD:protein FMN transferase [Rhodospirillaceae bacterium]|jgi:FAD:protein FMN transferase|nr:FAD:protein FMN transferase [Rhodospirillaceae bacterium]MBT4690059.1 FAD:protein FMN transferase [Rhodospirillaceae bacterium]MBT5079176.1 FAD:protein FMN transferase [Rhodospirillaceae bacterium]MBT5527458.1 FAD:protein FMN transferase [Rhodospirillaceae bacterium]MBT5878713.1 FAD:protein FMN transferase [Rhodospirillaceae bacterium]